MIALLAGLIELQWMKVMWPLKLTAVLRTKVTDLCDMLITPCVFIKKGLFFQSGFQSRNFINGIWGKKPKNEQIWHCLQQLESWHCAYIASWLKSRKFSKIKSLKWKNMIIALLLYKLGVFKHRTIDVYLVTLLQQELLEFSCSMSKNIVVHKQKI